MPDQPTHAELVALRSELEKHGAAPAQVAASPSEPPAAERDQGPSQVEQALRDLQSALTEAADSAEDVIAAHPIPSVVAAVLLGFVVGWLAARV